MTGGESIMDPNTSKSIMYWESNWFTHRNCNFSVDSIRKKYKSMYNDFVKVKCGAFAVCKFDSCPTEYIRHGLDSF